MPRPSIAVLGVLAGFACGSCGSDSVSDTLPDGKADADVAVSSPEDATVAPTDGALVAPGTRACESNPQEGEACDPLPAGVFCRRGSCTGGCEKECRCNHGIWRCEVLCRDYFSAIPIHCGTPPLCLDHCEEATILPDGGIAVTDASFTAGIRYRVSFSPPDMTTLWDTQALRVAIAMGPPLSAGWATDLAGRISLRTWPEMNEIPSVVTLADSPSSTEMAAISIKPSASLSDRWYALRLSAPPFWMAVPVTHVAPDGSYVARFRTGSEPSIQSVTFAGGPNKHRLYIALSEPVVAASSPAAMVHVQYGGTRVACSDVDFVAGRSTPILSFDCPSLTAFPDQITIDAGLLSTTGAAFAPVTIAKSDLSLSSSCGQYCEVGTIP